MTLVWTFLGVPPSILLPLGAALGAATVLLYILRLRRRPVIVPFAPIWEKQLGDQYASRLRSRLRRLLSLLLHLALLLALLLSLADPRPDSYAEPATSTVLLMDVSASMGAKTTIPQLQKTTEPPASKTNNSSADETTETSSRLDVAKDWARRFFDQMGPRDEVLVVELSETPHPLSAWSRPTEKLAGLISDLVPQKVTADLPAALAVARDALVERKRGQVIIVSDGAFPSLEHNAFPALDVRFASTSDGEPETSSAAKQTNKAPSKAPYQDNVGISTLSARRYPLDPARFEVLLEVANTGSTPAEVEVALHRTQPDMSQGDVVDVLRLEVPQEGRATEVIANLSAVKQGIIGTVRRLDGGANWLGADDTAYALLTERPPLDVLVVGDDNTFLDAALLVDPNLNVNRIAAENYPPSQAYDVVIFDAAFPARKATTGAALYLGKPSSDEEHYPVGTGQELKLFGFDRWKEESSVFRFIDPYDVQVLTGRALIPQKGDEVLGYSQQNPIFIGGSRPQGRFLALGFDPRKSDFVLRGAWPLFIQNALFELSPETSADLAQNIFCGVPSQTQVSTHDGFARFVGPLASERKSARRLAIKSGQVSVSPSFSGFYRLSDEKSSRVLAANFFNEAEAQLAPRRQLLRDNGLPLTKPASLKPPPSSWLDRLRPSTSRWALQPWMWLLLLVAAISFSEWWTYHRRWTV